MEHYYLFIGEKRSATAIARDWSWTDGHLAAKTLMDAVLACLPTNAPRAFAFGNAFYDDGSENAATKDLAALAVQHGMVVVGLGKKAQAKLKEWHIPHRCMIHPAARGAIRTRAVYRAHVASILLP